MNTVNEFTKLDPTLPRLDNIPCPNEDEDGIVEGEDDDFDYLDVKAQTFCKVTAKRCYLYFAQNNQGILLLIGIGN